MRRGARSNKALHLPSNSAFQLWFGSLLASTLGARAASEALLAVAERPSARPREKKARPMFDPKEFVRFCQAALEGPDPSAMIHAELLRIVAQPGEIEPPLGGHPKPASMRRPAVSSTQFVPILLLAALAGSDSDCAVRLGSSTRLPFALVEGPLPGAGA